MKQVNIKLKVHLQASHFFFCHFVSCLVSIRQQSSPMSNLAEGDEEEARMEEEQEAKLAEMEAEMEKERETRKLAGASEEEIQKALELLQRQHEAKRKVEIESFILFTVFII